MYMWAGRLSSWRGVIFYNFKILNRDDFSPQNCGLITRKG